MTIGSLRCARQFHLPRKDFFLCFPRGMIVKVIQPNLAPGDDFGMAGQIAPSSAYESEVARWASCG